MLVYVAPSLGSRLHHEFAIFRIALPNIGE